jgi:hypothetical protein
MHDASAYAKLSHSVKLSEVDLGTFDALFIAGGHGVCVVSEKVRMQIARRLLELHECNGITSHVALHTHTQTHSPFAEAIATFFGR